MAVSGSKNFVVTRSDIINAALRKVGGYDPSESPAAEETADASMALNLLVKEISTEIDIPWRETVTLFLQPATRSYTIGLTGDHATTSYDETTLSADAATSATTITLTSTTGLTAADYIGIKLNDGTIHWTTIVNATTTTIATGLASAASSGNAVYAYTTKAYRPQRIVYAYRRDSSGIDTEVTLIGEAAYHSLSNKGADGPVTQAFYKQTMTNGTIYVWPDNTSGNDKLILVGQNLADDFDSSGDNPQFPVEWSNVLVWKLALELAPEYEISGQKFKEIKAMAEEKYWTMLSNDVENASVIFGRE